VNLESFGAGAGGSVIGIILGYFGISKRVDKLEAELDKKVSEETCERCMRDRDARLDRMENKIDKILERL
jgi:hypothetical protein